MFPHTGNVQKTESPPVLRKMYPPQQVFLNLVFAIFPTSMNSPLEDLGESTNCLKLFSELCMNVYMSIFLRKEVTIFHQILKGSRDLKQNPSLDILCRSAPPNIEA